MKQGHTVTKERFQRVKSTVTEWRTLQKVNTKVSLNLTVGTVTGSTTLHKATVMKGSGAMVSEKATAWKVINPQKPINTDKNII